MTTTWLDVNKVADEDVIDMPNKLSKHCSRLMGGENDWEIRNNSNKSPSNRYHWVRTVLICYVLLGKYSASYECMGQRFRKME